MTKQLTLAVLLSSLPIGASFEQDPFLEIDRLMTKQVKTMHKVIETILQESSALSPSARFSFFLNQENDAVVIRVPMEQADNLSARLKDNVVQIKTVHHAIEIETIARNAEASLIRIAHTYKKVSDARNGQSNFRKSVSYQDARVEGELDLQALEQKEHAIMYHTTEKALVITIPLKEKSQGTPLSVGFFATEPALIPMPESTEKATPSTTETQVVPVDEHNDIPDEK